MSNNPKAWVESVHLTKTGISLRILRRLIGVSLRQEAVILEPQ